MSVLSKLELYDENILSGQIDLSQCKLYAIQVADIKNEEKRMMPIFYIWHLLPSYNSSLLSPDIDQNLSNSVI